MQKPLPDWVHEAFKAVVANDASDLYLCVGMPVSLRKSRQVRPLQTPLLTPEATLEAVLSLFPSRTEAELAQAPDLDAAMTIEGAGRFRLHAFRQRGLWSLVARIIPTDAPDHQALGLPASVVQLMEKRQGLVLVTGATGSGKSTSVAALLRYINEKHSRHIVTVEDPVEFIHTHRRSIVQQREVGTDTPSYPRGLHATLREAADVIMVGELRDTESMRTALHAAETGHLVLSTLHTASAVETVDRLLDSFPADEQPMVRSLLAATLLGVLSQVLAPKVGGGMVGVFEVLIGNSAVKALINKGQTAQLTGALQTGGKDGMQSLEQHLAARVKGGLVSMDDALVIAKRPDELRLYLGGGGLGGMGTGLGRR